MTVLHLIVPLFLSAFFLFTLLRLPSSSSTLSSPSCPLPSSSPTPFLPSLFPCPPTLSLVSSPSYIPSPCRFASLVPPAALVNNASLASRFILDVLYWEGQFLLPAPCAPFLPPSSYVGFHNTTGVTLDGHRLSVETGLPIGDPHPFTASSKESLHVALLALALAPSPAAPLASLFLAPSNPSGAVDEALRQLRLKVNSYDLFNCRYPGFGGFLPWVHVNSTGLSPQPGWERTVPGLDNGQLIWAVIALTHHLDTFYPHELHTPLTSPDCAWSPDSTLLTSTSTTLGQRWRRLLTRWRENLMAVFYDGKGRFRDVSHILNTSDTRIVPGNYATDPECNDGCYLDDPYEGELFTTYAYLYCDWGEEDPQALWERKRAKLKPATLKLSSGAQVTVQRGFWFSAHEQWKYLFMPYRDVSINDRIFVLSEKARVLYSAEQKIPGLYASVNGLAPTDDFNFPYDSDCGVAELATQPVDTRDIITPYGAMNLMLLLHPPRSPAPNVSSAVGLAWLANAIRSNRGQTCFGVVEGSAVNGTMVAPMKTWDTSVTTVLGMLGGVVDVVREAMMKDGVYGAFVDVVEDEWTRVFGGEGQLKGEDLEWPLPTAEVPNAQPEWASCTAQDNVCLCSAEQMEEHIMRRGTKVGGMGIDERHPADHSWTRVKRRRWKCPAEKKAEQEAAAE